MSKEPQIPYNLATNPNKAEILAILKLCKEKMLDLHFDVTIAEDIEKYKSLVNYLFPLIHSKVNSNEFKEWVKSEEQRLLRIKQLESQNTLSI